MSRKLIASCCIVAIGLAVFLIACVPATWVATRVFGYVAGLVITGELSRGDFILLFTYYLILAFACIELGALWLRVQEAAAGLSRVFFLMDLPGESEDRAMRALTSPGSHSSASAMRRGELSSEPTTGTSKPFTL